MADRGTYRAIKVVLLDGPDFQELPERSRWVFLTLKMSLGPSGIEMHYPEALVHNISARTGADPDDVRSSLSVLEEHGWIIREGNVIWITGQLKHDPGLKAENPKHRVSIQKHVAGLPHLRIVRSFIDAHPEFFPPDEYTYPNGYPEPSDSLSVHQIPKTKDRIPSTEEREPRRAPAREDSPAGGGSLSGSDSPGSVGAHRDPEPSDSHSIAYPKESDRLSVHQRPKTKDQIPNTEEREPKRAPAREVFHTGGGVPSGSDPPGSDGGLDPPHPGQRMSGAEVLVAWENAQPVAASAAERRKQKPFARRIADGHTREQVMAAFVGIGQLFPHCAPKNQPWDLSDLDRKFSKAVAAARDHPELKSRRFDEEFTAMTER